MLIDASPNDYMQAVLQVLLRVEALAEFFMLKIFRQVKQKGVKQGVCEAFARLYVDVNADQLPMLSQMEPTIKLNEFAERLEKEKAFSPDKAENAGSFIQYILGSVLAEIGY